MCWTDFGFFIHKIYHQEIKAALAVDHNPYESNRGPDHYTNYSNHDSSSYNPPSSYNDTTHEQDSATYEQGSPDNAFDDIFDDETVTEDDVTIKEDVDPDYVPPSKQYIDVLKEYFGHSKFRP